MNKLFADMHCDTITTLYDKIQEGRKIQESSKKPEGSGDTLRVSGLQLDLEKLNASHYALQNFAIFLDKEKYSNLYEEAMKRIAFFKEEVAKNTDLINQVTSYKEILDNCSKGHISALLTLEGGEILEGKTENLHRFHKEGVRMITLTWNYPNELGYSHFDKMGNGLTKKGFEMVEAMEDLHMIPDVSHGSDTLFYDVCKVTRKPFVASHSNARNIYNHSRNMSDDMIKTLANRGGVIGLNFYSGFVSAKCQAEGICYMKDMVAHALHIIKTGGVECLGLGSDFDGIDTDVEWKDASGMMQFADALKKAGLSEGDCDKIVRDNVLRVYKDCLE